MTTYKTMSGLVNATEKVIAELETHGITSHADEQRLDKITSNLSRQLNALWSNPADVEDMAKLNSRLADACNKAMGV